MAKKKVQKTKAGKLDAGKLGLASGFLCAAYVFLMTLLATWIGYGQHWVLSIQDVYGFLGYSMSFVGAILGAIYAFIDGFVFVWLLALIYNKLVWNYDKRNWYLGFLGFLGIQGIVGILNKEYIQAIWLVWFIYFRYFFEGKK